MPTVLNYAPWLAAPTPGSRIFTPSTSPLSQAGDRKQDHYVGAKRTIVRRGTEIFVAVGKELRWTDLAKVKEAFEDGQEDEEQNCCTIKTSVADDIRQLVISPFADYLAIVTKHNIHIAFLPTYAQLSAGRTLPKLKTHTLGPEIHVTTKSAIVSAIWHPLGVDGSCIVTVTEEAVVRLWELSTSNRMSFDTPTLSIDLQKLIDGVTVDQNFGASRTVVKTFSPDSVEMQVASACFPDRHSGGWSPMTLWIAMREGDVYALCPLLPEKWSPPPSLIPSLSVSIVAKVALLEDESTESSHAQTLAQQQLAWMSDLDGQTPISSKTAGEASEIYKRPLKPGRVPKLQGPYDIALAPEETDDDLDLLLSDIFVIGSKVDMKELMSGEEDDHQVAEMSEEGLSTSVVCLLSSSGRLSLCLDIDSVEAQWLPITAPKVRRSHDDVEFPVLLTLQTIDTLTAQETYPESWPMFSTDPTSTCAFYVTQAAAISHISLAPWIVALSEEMDTTGGAGVEFRLAQLVQDPKTTRQRIISRAIKQGSTTEIAACVALQDLELGHMLISASPSKAVAVEFEPPAEPEGQRLRSPTYDETQQQYSQPMLLYTPREVYQPPQAFTAQSGVPHLLGNLKRSKYKRLIDAPIKLSPATLSIFTDVHKTMSEETHRIGTAAAELFRRCRQLQIELREHIKRANEVADRVEAAAGIGADTDDFSKTGNNLLESRLDVANERQRDLTERLDALRKKISRGAEAKELSEQEKTWFEEVAVLERNIIRDTEQNDTEIAMRHNIWKRFQELQALTQELLDQVADIKINAVDDGIVKRIPVPSDVRKQKSTQVQEMLERQAALVEATKGRLERLTLE